MAKTVIGLFDNLREAQPIVQALVDDGFRREDIRTLTSQEGAAVGTLTAVGVPEPGRELPQVGPERMPVLPDEHHAALWELEDAAEKAAGAGQVVDHAESWRHIEPVGQAPASAPRPAADVRDTPRT